MTPRLKLLEMDLPQEEINESIFENGTFEELETVKDWIRDMRRS